MSFGLVTLRQNNGDDGRLSKDEGKGRVSTKG